MESGDLFGMQSQVQPVSHPSNHPAAYHRMHRPSAANENLTTLLGLFMPQSVQEMLDMLCPWVIWPLWVSRGLQAV